jgi:hypothetical protein
MIRLMVACAPEKHPIESNRSATPTNVVSATMVTTTTTAMMILIILPPSSVTDAELAEMRF